jgi:heme/copper-type cytochrome/quinol oxidase subunit 2
MSSLTTFNDSGLMIIDCHNTNIYMMLIISSLVFLLMIYVVCFRSKSNTELEVKIDKIDKNIVNLIKTFRELKKID